MPDEIVSKFTFDPSDSVEKVGSVRAEMRKLKEALLEIPKNDPQWGSLFQRYNELASKTRELSRMSRVLDNSLPVQKYLKLAEAGVGAFSAVRASMKLMGVQNENVLKSLEELESLMVLMRGIKMFSEGLKTAQAMWTMLKLNIVATKGNVVSTQALGEAQIAQAGASRAAAIATNTLGYAMKALGIGLIIAAVAYLVDNWKDLKKEFSGMLPDVGNLSDKFDTFKTIIVGVGSAVVSVLLVPIKELIQTVKTTIAVFEDLKAGNFKKAFTDIGDGIKEGIEIAKDGLNVVKNFEHGVSLSRQAQADEAHKKSLEEEIKHQEQMIAIAEASGKDSFKMSVDFIKKKKELYADDKEKLEGVLQDERILYAEHNKMLSEEAKKALEKRLEEEKKENERLEHIQEEHLKRLLKTREDADAEERKENEALAKANIDFVNAGNKVDETSYAWKLQQLNKTYQELREKNKGNLAELIALDISYNNQKKAIDEDQARKDAIAKDRNAMDQVKIIKTREDTELAKLKLSYAEKIAIAKKADEELKAILASGNLDKEHAASVSKTIGEGEKRIDKELADSKKASVAAIGGALNTLSGIVSKNSIAGKAIAIGQATINTFQGATLALANAPGPVGIVEMAAVIAAGLVQIGKIASTKVAPGDSTGGSIPGTGGAGLSFNAPSIQSTPNTTNLSPSSIAGIQNASQQNNQVYVSESDITGTQARVSQYQNAGTIGH